MGAGFLRDLSRAWQRPCQTLPVDITLCLLARRPPPCYPLSLCELDTIERDGSVSRAEWLHFFHQYRLLDGGTARRATARAIASIEATIALKTEMAEVRSGMAATPPL